MKKAFYYFIIFLLLASCSNKKKSLIDKMPPLYPVPQALALNTDGGYIINPVTRDSIQPLINSLGDTIKTGVPIPVKGKIIHPDSVGQAIIIPAGEPPAVPISRNVFKIPENLTIIPVDKDKLRTFTPGVDTPIYELVHQSGDTIPTGLPIPTKGKLVRCVQPQSVIALPPSMKKDARLNIKYLNEPQGMPSSYVQSIVEDRQGNLWFGTFDEGVIKYNGNTFTHFTEKEGLSNNYLSSILEDSHGNLWFGTVGGGVNMYNGETFTHFSHDEGLINSNILCIMADSHDNIWFGTEGGGAARYTGKTITHFTTKEGLQDNNVRSIMEDRQGNIWFGTDRGASKYNGEIFTHFDNRDGLRNTITSILEDRRGDIWFGTDFGVYKYDGESFIHFYEKVGFNNEHINSIFEDSQGKLWFGSKGGGIIIYDGQTLTRIYQADGLSCNHVNSILEDSHGNMWIGTNTGGVSMYSNIPFTYLSYEEGLSYNYVASISEDNRGNLWFGTGWRLSKYNGEYFTVFDTNHGLSDNWIYSTLEDSQGNLWLGTRDGGVNKFNGETFTHYTEREGLSNNRVYSILEDRNGNLWFGTEDGGVSKYNGETFTHYTEKEGLSNNDIRSIAEDSQGNLWFGTYGSGVIKYNGETIIHITEKEGLGSNLIHCIFEDSHGNLWFGTEDGGASIFNGETFIHITEREGLSDNCAWSIMEDNNRNIWIGTRIGLNYLDFGSSNVFRTDQSLYTTEVEKDGSEATLYHPVIHTYTFQDGLKQKRIIERCMYLDRKNRIWMGNGGVCLITLDMNNFKIPVDPPKMQIDRIEINEQFADYRQLKDSPGIEYDFTDVARYNNYPLNLELPFNNNHLTFHFSAIDWSGPHKIKYSYKMVGLDKEWSKPSPEAKADYRSLPFGKYTFKVRSIGTTQKWSDTFEYPFIIHPPWWFRWWVIVIECFLAISLLITIIRFRERNLRQRAVLLEQKVDQKTREVLEQRMEVDELKSRFFTNISHEFRTPLTLIMGPLRDIEKQKGDSFSISRKTVSTLGRNARRLLLLINQLLDISKMEKKAMKLNLEIGDLSRKLQILVSSFQSLAESQNIEFIIDIASCPVKACYDADKVEKVVINLLSNAFKFTPNDGKVVLQLTYRIDEVHKDQCNAVLKVTDNGRGIEKKDLEKIFDRFYQVVDKEYSDQQGTGIGLALINELIHLMHGKIDVESIPGERTTFSVTFPVTKECFLAEEVNFTRDEPLNEEESEITNSDDPIPEGELILVVEDNDELREYIRDLFKPDYQVLEAENGKTGLESAIEYIPDLVITDLMMPVMGGMDLCKELKEHPASNHIPVIMLTAKADKDSKMEGLEAAADDYFIKPFDSEELIVRAKNLMRLRSDLRKSFEQKFIMDNSGGEPNSPQFLLLRKFTKVFDPHMHDPDYSVVDLADEFNMSRSQLFRKTKAIFGASPNELMRLTRFKRAASLLRSGNLNVTQVMYQVGMQSPSYFAKTFKKFYGVNPGEYQSRT